MKKAYFRKTQRANANSMLINIPRDVSKNLGLSIGDVVMYDLSNGIVELKKIDLNIHKEVKQ